MAANNGVLEVIFTLLEKEFKEGNEADYNPQVCDQEIEIPKMSIKLIKCYICLFAGY